MEKTRGPQTCKKKIRLKYKIATTGLVFPKIFRSKIKVGSFWRHKWSVKCEALAIFKFLSFLIFQNLSEIFSKIPLILLVVTHNWDFYLNFYLFHTQCALPNDDLVKCWLIWAGPSICKSPKSMIDHNVSLPVICQPHYHLWLIGLTILDSTQFKTSQHNLFPQLKAELVYYMISPWILGQNFP